MEIRRITTKFFGNCIPPIEVIVYYEAKSWPKHMTNV